MQEYELKNTDPEDIEDLLMKVETSFNIQFKTEDFNEIKTFGNLCDLIINKIKLKNAEDCTSQQAFYKLRDAVVSTPEINSSTLTLDSNLAEIFPKENRRSAIRKVEKQLGFKLAILIAPSYVYAVLSILLISSLVAFFFSWKIALLGITSSIIGFKIANYFGNVLDLQTVRQVAEKITREHYVQSRRNPNTFNRNEIEKILTEWFSEDLDIDKSKLTRETEWI